MPLWHKAVHLLLQDILRVLYPQALDKDLAEMLSVVTPKKHVKGHNNLEQQIAELKEVFAVYDEDGTGQLKQAEFVEAIVSAGESPTVQELCLAACFKHASMRQFLSRINAA